MSIKSIAVIGAGVMGTDIALNLAMYNYDVILKDINESCLIASKDKMKKSFRMYKMMNADYKHCKLDEVISRISFQETYDNFETVDLVIENIEEDYDKKKQLYCELVDKCKEDVIYAVNTSCISITKISSLVSKKENVIGVHFMNPVPLKPLVEVVKGYFTSSETIDNLNDFLKGINKQSVVVNDFPGFVANRLSHLFMNEAAYLIQEGTATAEQVDMIFKKGYGHQMGPLETADLIGLDTVVNSLKILYQSYQDSKFRCCPLLQKMVDAGLYGRKSGQGFYKY